jgi:DNA repair ATPase RecN
MTGAGKSVIIADLLAQIGHRFGFRLIVEEGLSHAGADPNSRLRTDHRESKRVFCLRKQG